MLPQPFLGLNLLLIVHRKVLRAPRPPKKKAKNLLPPPFSLQNPKYILFFSRSAIGEGGVEMVGNGVINVS